MRVCEQLRRFLVAACLVPFACGAPTDGGASDAGGTGTSTTSETTTGSSTTTAASTPTTGEATTQAADGTTTMPAATTAEPLTTGETGEATTGGSTTTGDGTTTTEGSTTTGGAGPLDDVLRLHHVQVKGTHNSYHVEPLIPFDASHEYTHAPLDVQLEEQGVRAFELDVHKGLGEFEVYHISVIDSVSTCETLKACLGIMRAWSLAHVDHLPIVVWIEIKDSTGGLPIGAGDLDDLDDTIRGVLPPEQLFTPDDLQGAYPSVRAALEAEGWPTLGELRGKFIVVLLNVEEGHAEDYTDGYTSLAGRAMFARATPEQFGLPWAAIAKLGIDDAEDIAAAHAGNMLIATNVCGAGDDDPECTEAMMKAKSAGIHMLKDDFPAPVDGMTYFLDFPDGNPARCNPVTAPPKCTSVALEDL